MIVFSMLLMLCGQTLAGALMWCCLAGDAAVVAQPAQTVHAMHMPHHHGHAMAAEVDGDEMASSHTAMDASRILAHLLDGDHSCASSCSNAAMLAAAPVPRIPSEFVLTLAEAVPALPQANPSLPLRPPNLA